MTNQTMLLEVYAEYVMETPLPEVTRANKGRLALVEFLAATKDDQDRTDKIAAMVEFIGVAVGSDPVVAESVASFALVNFLALQKIREKIEKREAVGV